MNNTDCSLCFFRQATHRHPFWIDFDYTSKITSFSECIFRVYLIPGCNQKISLYLVWKSIICSTKSLLNHPYIYFLKGKIHVLNLNRISVIRIDSLLNFCISKLICRDQNKIYNFHLLTSSRLSTVWDKNNNECLIFCNPVCRKSNNSCWLSRLLIWSRGWSKWKSCWSHFIFYKSNLKWKISTRNQNLWLILWFPLFRFYLSFHSWSEK